MAHIQAVVAQTEIEAVPRTPQRTTDKTRHLSNLAAKEAAEDEVEDEANPEILRHLQEPFPLKPLRTVAQGGHLEAASVLA